MRSSSDLFSFARPRLTHELDQCQMGCALANLITASTSSCHCKNSFVCELARTKLCDAQISDLYSWSMSDPSKKTYFVARKSRQGQLASSSVFQYYLPIVSHRKAAGDDPLVSAVALLIAAHFCPNRDYVASTPKD